MMDDKLHKALEETAKEMMDAYDAAIKREARNPHLNRDGLCFITWIRFDVFPPAIAEVTTSLAETLPVFSRIVVDHLLVALTQGRAVRLFMRRSEHGSRYIRSAWIAPIGTEATYECAECGDMMTRGEDGIYRCSQCHWICQPKTADDGKK